MTSHEADQLIIEAVQSHYEQYDSPYYLAELGNFFRSNNLEIPAGVRFKEYLISRFHSRLSVVQDPDNPARIAITPPDHQQRIQQLLAGQSTDSHDDFGIDYTRLPFALIAAFCQVPLPGTQVYFRLTRPFRYDNRVKAPDDEYADINEQFRPSSVAGKSVHYLSDNDKQTIYSNIKSWADHNSIDLRDIYYDRGLHLSGNAREHRDPKDNALQRLVDAQDPDLKQRIRIPGDIASTLMRLP